MGVSSFGTMAVMVAALSSGALCFVLLLLSWSWVAFISLVGVGFLGLLGVRLILWVVFHEGLATREGRSLWEAVF